MVKAGDLCFVKVRGYSPWPARVNVLPNDVVIPRGKVPVFFYGTHEVSFVPEHLIFEYEKYKDVYGIYKPKNIRFNQGMKELQENPKVLQLRFDKGAIPFLSQFYKFNKKSADMFDYETIREKSKEKDCLKTLDYETSTGNCKDKTKIISYNLKTKKLKTKETLDHETLTRDLNEPKTSFPEIDKEKLKEKDYKIFEISKENELKGEIKDETLDYKISENSKGKESVFQEIKGETLDNKMSEISEEKESMFHEIKVEISKEEENLFDKQSPEERSDSISKDNLDYEIKKNISKDNESWFKEIKIEKQKEISVLHNVNSTIKSTENKETSDYDTECVKSEEIEDVIKSKNSLKRFRSSFIDMEHHLIKRACSVILNSCLENYNDISETKTNIKNTEVQNNDISTKVDTIISSNKEDLENNLSGNIQSSDKESKKDTDSFKTPLDGMEVYNLNRAKAMKLHEKFKSYLLEHAHLNNFTDYPLKSNIKDEKKKLLKRKSFHHLKRKKNSTAAIIKRSDTFIQYTKPPKIKDEEKNLRIVSQLSVIDKEIKRSLIVGQENHNTCINLMMKLESLEGLRLIFLCKVPDIVTTMRKCRRYKKNETIKSSATAIYQRFYNIYQLSDIEEKSEGGAELLRRDSTDLKSAQQLLDEIFVPDSKGQRCKSMMIPNIVLSSPSSSFNTPTITTDYDSVIAPDYIILHINDLLKNGSLQLIEVYESKKHSHHSYFVEVDLRNNLDLYKQLGV